MEIDFGEDGTVAPARIKVVGVGGGGGNAVNTMVRSGRLARVDFIAANSDWQDLTRNQAEIKLQIGQGALRGLGCGADPEKGRRAAEDSEADIQAALEGADMVFITAGMGGGTGTGAAPIVARIAKEMGALTVGVVTRPFWFEGAPRDRKAVEGLSALREQVDSLIVIPNDKLLQLVGQNTPATEAFMRVDEVLLDAVCGISEIIDIGGLINVDFADVRTIMAQQGRALMGTGRAVGERRAEIAAQNAISSPLLDDVRVEGATGILINVTGSANLGLHEIQAACAPIHAAASGDAAIIFGAVIDPNMGDEVKVTVIATGIESAEDRAAATRRRQVRMADTDAAAAQARVAPPMPAAAPAQVWAAPPAGERQTFAPRPPMNEAAPGSSRRYAPAPGTAQPAQAAGGLPLAAARIQDLDRPTFVRRREAERLAAPPQAPATARAAGPPPPPMPAAGTSEPASAAAPAGAANPPAAAPSAAAQASDPPGRRSWLGGLAR